LVTANLYRSRDLRAVGPKSARALENWPSLANFPVAPTPPATTQSLGNDESDYGVLPIWVTPDRPRAILRGRPEAVRLQG
jgi:hypothetical protein